MIVWNFLADLEASSKLSEIPPTLSSTAVNPDVSIPLAPNNLATVFAIAIS